MAMRSVVVKPMVCRRLLNMEGSAAATSAALRYFSNRVLGGEQRAAENVYFQKMERERMEKLKEKTEKEKAEKEKAEKEEKADTLRLNLMVNECMDDVDSASRSVKNTSSPSSSSSSSSGEFGGASTITGLRDLGHSSSSSMGSDD